MHLVHITVNVCELGNQDPDNPPFPEDTQANKASSKFTVVLVFLPISPKMRDKIWDGKCKYKTSLQSCYVKDSSTYIAVSLHVFQELLEQLY